MNIEVKSQEIAEKLKMMDRAARLEGVLHFPEHPNSHKDLAASKIIFSDRPIGAIYLFWKSIEGKIHHRKLATAFLHNYKLFISKVVMTDGGDISIMFSAQSLRGSESFTNRICGRLSEDGERWKGEFPKRAMRFI